MSRQPLLRRVRPLTTDGTDERLEWYKSTQFFDSPPHRHQHGFPKPDEIAMPVGDRMSALKTLVCFPFSGAERAILDDVAREHGGHKVVHADAPGDALAAAGDVEAVMGNLTPALLFAARAAEWAHSFGSGMDKVLNEEVAAL